jgi:hypothetical protein
LLIAAVAMLVLMPPLGVLLLYPLLASVFDRTVITIRDGWLRVVNRPLPFPRGGSVRVADVEGLHVKISREPQGQGKRSLTSYTGVARLRSGGERPLLHEMSSTHADERVRWAVEELTRELESGRWNRSQGLD